MDFKSEDVKPSQQPAAPASSPHTEPRASAEGWRLAGTLAACLLGASSPHAVGQPCEVLPAHPRAGQALLARALLRFSAMGWRRPQAEESRLR